MSLLRRVGIVMLSSFMGALLAVALSLASATGMFVAWVSLEKPPEPATKILAITNGLWVQTASGIIYLYTGQYTGSSDCKDQCWIIDTNPLPDPAPVFQLNACGQLPMYIGARDVKASCSPWGPRAYLSVYAIDSVGNVHTWGHGVTEDDTMMFLASPVIGVVLGFVIGISIVVSKTQRREK